MKNIKSLNEYLNTDLIYVVSFHEINDSDFFRSSYISNQVFFRNELKAYDYVVRYINKNTNKYETFFDDDGHKFCLKLEDNPDYKEILGEMKSRNVTIEIRNFMDNNYIKNK